MLSKEELWMRKFDACVKRALIQELKYRKRSMKNQREHFVNFSELSCLEEQHLSHSRKNRHKKALKNGMNRSFSLTY